MRFFLAIAALLSFFAAPLAHAAPPPDPTLTQGLQTCVTNGIEAGVRSWYADRPELGAEMTGKIAAAAAKLGSIIDSEVVAVQPVSKRVTRYYVALYFARSPLWIRIERYQGSDKSFFLPLKCSVNPDEILPGYVTEFYQ